MSDLIVAPEINAYGKDARHSSLADLLEWQAIRGESQTQAELSDFIRDAGWHRLLREQFHEPEVSAGLDAETEDLAEETDSADTFSEQVFEVIAERVDVLKGRYPFLVKDHRLTYTGSSSSHSAYVELLALTLAHAYDLPLSFKPTRYFEELVAAALSARGLRAGNLASQRRTSGNLADALNSIADMCDLRPTPEHALVPAGSHDEGVDVVAHMSWNDSRPMHWVYIVQATCAESGAWKMKALEPSTRTWQTLLGCTTEPRAVLAVPHHIPRLPLQYLLTRDPTRLVLDRLRLCGASMSPSPNGTELLDVIRGTALEGLSP